MAQYLDTQGCSLDQPQDPFVTGLGLCLVAVVALDGLDSFMDILLYPQFHSLLHQPFMPFQHRCPRTIVGTLVVDSSSASYPLYNGKQTNPALHIEGVVGSTFTLMLSLWPISP